AASPRQAAHSRRRPGLLEYDAPLPGGSRVNSTGAVLGGPSPLWLGRRISLPHPVHLPIAVPDFYAGIVVGGEQAVSARLRLSVGLALDHVVIGNMVGVVEEYVS